MNAHISSLSFKVIVLITIFTCFSLCKWIVRIVSLFKNNPLTDVSWLGSVLRINCLSRGVMEAEI